MGIPQQARVGIPQQARRGSLLSPEVPNLMGPRRRHPRLLAGEARPSNPRVGPCRAVPGRAGPTCARPPPGLGPCSRLPPAALGPAHGALGGTRTQGAGRAAARGKVELGEVGSGGDAPRSGLRGQSPGVSAGAGRPGGTPRPPLGGHPVSSPRVSGEGGGGAGPERAPEGGREGSRRAGERRQGGREGRKRGDWSGEGVEVEERAETGARGSPDLGSRMRRRALIVLGGVG